MKHHESIDIWHVKHMCWLSQEAVKAQEEKKLELAELIRNQIKEISAKVLSNEV